MRTQLQPYTTYARFNALFRKSVRWGILDRLFNFDELKAVAENRLFKRFSVNLNNCFISCYLWNETPVICYGRVGIIFCYLLFWKFCSERVMLSTIYIKTSNAKCELTFAFNDWISLYKITIWSNCFVCAHCHWASIKAAYLLTYLLTYLRLRLAYSVITWYSGRKFQ
jgi:hypothetical protein